MGVAHRLSNSRLFRKFQTIDNAGRHLTLKTGIQAIRRVKRTRNPSFLRPVLHYACLQDSTIPANCTWSKAVKLAQEAPNFPDSPRVCGIFASHPLNGPCGVLFRIQ